MLDVFTVQKNAADAVQWVSQHALRMRPPGDGYSDAKVGVWISQDVFEMMVGVCDWLKTQAEGVEAERKRLAAESADPSKPIEEAIRDVRAAMKDLPPQTVNVNIVREASVRGRPRVEVNVSLNVGTDVPAGQ